jgi:hypothetical protein
MDSGSNFLVEMTTFFFFAEKESDINTLFLQKDPERTKNYNEALLLGTDSADAQKPTVTRRCRRSSTRLG